MIGLLKRFSNLTIGHVTLQVKDQSGVLRDQHGSKEAVIARNDSERRVTMQDIADRVGVSKALVSMVFRNVNGPSATTRERVMEVAEELDYRPNRAAALLSLRRTKLIGVTAEIRNSFHTELVDFLIAEADRVGYEVALGPVTAGRTLEAAVDTLLEFQCEALILLGPQLGASALRSIDHRAPVVSIGRTASGSGVDVVRTADARGIAMLVDHLTSQGHRRIAHASGDGAIGKERASGYLKAMMRHGLPPLMLPSGFTELDGAAVARSIVKLDEPPSAVVCVNDRCAIGLLDSLRRRGIAVPERMSVTGFDDSQLASLAHINLTSVSQDPAEQARRAVAATLDRLDGRRTDCVSIVLRPHLVLRSTTGPATQETSTRLRIERSR